MLVEDERDILFASSLLRFSDTRYKDAPHERDPVVSKAKLPG